MTRRRARFVVLAMLLVSLVGPWDNPRSHFPRVVEYVLNRPLRWTSLLSAAILATLIATILAPSSRPPRIAYRLLAGGTAVWIIVRLASKHFSLKEVIETWGLALYIVAIALGSAMEFVPVRRPPKREYADVFR